MTLIDPATEVWNHSRSTGTERVVLLAIAKHADPDGYAWPGLKRLSGMANVGERATQGALAKLVLSGELAVLRGQGRGHASLYRVLLGQPEEAGDREVMLAWLRTKTAPHLAALYEKVNQAAPSAEVGKVQQPSPSGAEKVQDRAPEKVQDRSAWPTAYRNELPVVEAETLDPPTPQPTLVLVAQARPVDKPLALFKHWQASTGQQRAAFSTKRRTLAVKAIETYGLEYCLEAAEGWRHSPFHRGENDRGTVYNGFGLIFRDAEHVEQFHGFADGSILARQTHNGMTDWTAITAELEAQESAGGGPLAIGGQP